MKILSTISDALKAGSVCCNFTHSTCLLNSLPEHLNAQIVLGDMTDISIALNWLKSTYLWKRILKNPEHYHFKKGLPPEELDKKLKDRCIQDLNELHKHGLITMGDDHFSIFSTALGRVMASYYIAFKVSFVW